MADVNVAARRRGLVIETTTFGPAFRVIARRIPTRRGGGGGGEGDDAAATSSGREVAAEDDEDVIAIHDGFIAPPPFGILHLDSMRVYNSRVRGNTERATMRSVFGISILLGTTSALMARDAGCAKMELLAVDDGNEYAAKLVKYYRRLGFVPIRVVGDGAATDLFDLLVWGGAGTRMNGDLPALLGKWGKVVRKQASEAARAERDGDGEA
jgi:hypothetical protein